MPLPLLLIGGAALVGSFGVKQGYDAFSDHRKTKSLHKEGRDVFRRDEKLLEDTRASCTHDLEALGKLKLDIWDRQLGRFVCLFQELRNVDLQGAAGMDELGGGVEARLADMQAMTKRVAEAVGGGAIAVSSGALMGVASYGGATLLATASTGTAISSLSGVAATNATLAWFGGGSLAAGGLGVAGGAAILGGIVAAPVLAVGGTVLAAKARKNLALAKTNVALYQLDAKQMRAATTIVEGIAKVAAQVREVLERLDDHASEVLNDFEDLLDRRGSDYAEYAESERRIVHRAVVFAEGLKILLEAPLLDESGALAKGYPKALEHGRGMLAKGEAR